MTHRTRMPWLLFGSLQPMPMNEKLPLFDGREMRQPDQIFSARVLEAGIRDPNGRSSRFCSAARYCSLCR